MTLAELIIKISCDSNEAEKSIAKAEKSTSKLGGTFSKISKGVGTAGKAIGATVATASIAIGKLAINAVKAYSEYEQQVGGVKKLFDKDWETVVKDAKKAFKTVGVDANTYMKNVTSFSASLINSLDKDTRKAAEYSNRAMRDMSDNANTFGTSIESIQNAYQGFAKQNYTMLDNLKLGYGGTKTEMQRLIKDASKLTDVQKELGITVDANSLSFANIVNAISVMQKSMGIAGTTANEAATTIQGSLGMMKSAWMNLKIAIADPEGDVNGALQDLITSATTFAHNAMPAFSKAIKGMGTAIKELAPILANELPGLVTEVLPDLISAGVDLVGGIADAIVQNGDMIIKGFGQILEKAGESFEKSDNPVIKGIGTLLSTAGKIIKDPKNALMSAIAWVSENILGVDHEVAVNFKETGWDTVKAAFTMTKQYVAKQWELTVKFLRLNWQVISDAFSEASEWVGKTLYVTISWIRASWDTISTAFSVAAAWVGRTFNVTVNWIRTAWDTISTAFSVAATWVSRTFDVTVNWIRTAWDTISDAFSDATEWVGKTFNVTINWIRNAWDDVSNAFATAAEWVGKTFDITISWIVDSVQTVLDELAKIPREIVVTITQKIVESTPAKKAVSGITGWSDDTSAKVLDTGFSLFKSIFGGKAKGDWDVPYDNFPALLHRNEMVLSASQARRYRDGESGGIDLSSLASTIVGAIREGIANAQVNSYLDGKKVTDEINRRVGNEIAARRFA